MKHSKPTTKDISDIYDEYMNLNNDVNSILYKYSDVINIQELIKTNTTREDSKILNLDSLGSIITIYYNDELFSINNFHIDVSSIDQIFDTLNKTILNGYLKNLAKSNNLYDKSSSKKQKMYDIDFVSYNWRDLIKNNQLVLFLIIFNFFIDNPLNLIIDKFTTDLIKFVNHHFVTTESNLIEPYFKFIIPADVYDLSKKAEIITNSEHFMDKVSEILSLYHLLTGKNYLNNDESINILSMLHIYFFNNKKMDYTRHINMKLFKNIIENIYMNFNMRPTFAVASRDSSLVSIDNESMENKKQTNAKKPGKKWLFTNLINTLKNNNMSFTDKNFIFDKVEFWFNSLYQVYPKDTCLRIPYCCIAIDQLILLFSLANNKPLAYRNNLSYCLYAFDNLIDDNIKYETFYKLKQISIDESSAALNLKILKPNSSVFKSFNTIEEQMIWIINKEMTDPLTVLQTSSNKFIFKLAYKIIHGDLLQFISGKSLNLSKFKEIYEFIDLSKFNGINTTFTEPDTIMNYFNVNKNHFMNLSQNIINQKMFSSSSSVSSMNSPVKVKKIKVAKTKKANKVNKTSSVKKIEKPKKMVKSESVSSTTLAMNDVNSLFISESMISPSTQDTSSFTHYYSDMSVPKSLFEKKNMHNEPLEVFNPIELILDSN